jgi:cation diffusion facilitator family transporter
MGHTLTCDIEGEHEHVVEDEVASERPDIGLAPGERAEYEHRHDDADKDEILRSRDGIRTVSKSLAVLLIAAAAQVVIFLASGSVALLSDLIHNTGDALTAIPLGIAFFLRSARGEKWAGFAVVLAIFVSACVALYESIHRLIYPQSISHLWVLALAGLVGFVGNEIAAQVRLRGGKRLNSPALMADGKHARVDGFVSLGVVASAAVVALGVRVADPVIGILIGLVILEVTRDAWLTVRGHAHTIELVATRAAR